eukprot:TRINITY_DN52949_c0_g1_i2.p2 TRINITY_DN52949_c0_g1~~TRINITY_DN52949_c0_g1_i2.p2  ORF type:complete len:177 (-),score=11.24 TRINITY_DN52949_c0_g1_i2:744-1274(-)
MSIANTEQQQQQLPPAARYEFIQLLGKGAYGQVWKARDKITLDLVTVKVIQVAEQEEQEFDKIQREIAHLKECNHPNVVRYLDSYSTDRHLWIIMEYCGGGSVSDLLSAALGKSSTLPEGVISYVVKETLKGLIYLHSINVFRRDMVAVNYAATPKSANFTQPVSVNIIFPPFISL